jgi:hypothetical protein
MNVRKRLSEWWYGITPSVRETDDGGYIMRGQNPNYPPARDRLIVGLKAPATKWVLAALGTIAVAVIAGAILKFLRLS